MINTLLAVAAALVVGWIALASADALSASLDTTHDCVIATAQAQGYPDPYSQEAWTLFAPGCKK